MGYQMRVEGTSEFEQSVHIERDFGRGTSELCQAMVDLGMAFVSEVPEFPDSEHLDHTDFLDGQPITDLARAYVDELERVRAEHQPTFLPGIPSHKLTSGDGWLVTPAECSEALASYEFAMSAGAAHPRAFATDVVPFLRAAAQLGGFRVN